VALAHGFAPRYAQNFKIEMMYSVRCNTLCVCDEDEDMDMAFCTDNQLT
jgi:hypothetical protein